MLIYSSIEIFLYYKQVVGGIQGPILIKYFEGDVNIKYFFENVIGMNINNRIGCKETQTSNEISFQT